MLTLYLPYNLRWPRAVISKRYAGHGPGRSSCFGTSGRRSSSLVGQSERIKSGRYGQGPNLPRPNRASGQTAAAGTGCAVSHRLHGGCPSLGGYGASSLALFKIQYLAAGIWFGFVLILFFGLEILLRVFLGSFFDGLSPKGGFLRFSSYETVKDGFATTVISLLWFAGLLIWKSQL